MPADSSSPAGSDERRWRAKPSLCSTHATRSSQARAPRRRLQLPISRLARPINRSLGASTYRSLVATIFGSFVAFGVCGGGVAPTTRHAARYSVALGHSLRAPSDPPTHGKRRGYPEEILAGRRISPHIYRRKPCTNYHGGARRYCCADCTHLLSVGARRSRPCRATRNRHRRRRRMRRRGSRASRPRAGPRRRILRNRARGQCWPHLHWDLPTSAPGLT